MNLFYRATARRGCIENRWYENWWYADRVDPHQFMGKRNSQEGVDLRAATMLEF